MPPGTAKTIVVPLLLAVGLPQIAGAAAAVMMPLGLGKPLDFGLYTLIFGLIEIAPLAIVRGLRSYRAAIRENRARTQSGGHD